MLAPTRNKPKFPGHRKAACHWCIVRAENYNPGHAPAHDLMLFFQRPEHPQSVNAPWKGPKSGLGGECHPCRESPCGERFPVAPRAVRRLWPLVGTLGGFYYVEK